RRRPGRQRRGAHERHRPPRSRGRQARARRDREAHGRPLAHRARVRARSRRGVGPEVRRRAPRADGPGGPGGGGHPPHAPRSRAQRRRPPRDHAGARGAAARGCVGLTMGPRKSPFGHRPFGQSSLRGDGSRLGEPQLRADEYRLLRDLVAERLGIWFGPESRSSLERRLRERLSVHGLSSFSDYYQLLKYSPLGAEEWDEAGDLLTTHETYFFREDYQLRAFKDEILPMLAAKSRRRVQVWSAGCSTG